MKIPLNSAFIKALLRKFSITYSDVEVLTGGKIRQHDLKNALNENTSGWSEERLRALADLFGTDFEVERLIHPDFLRLSGAPSGIFLLITKLFVRVPNRISVYYRRYLLRCLSEPGTELLSSFARSIAEIMTRPELEGQPEQKFTLVAFFIREEVLPTAKSRSILLDGSYVEEVPYWYSERLTEAIETQSIWLVLLVFAYILALFEGIVLVELVGSAVQSSMVRSTSTIVELRWLAAQLSYLRSRCIAHLSLHSTDILGDSFVEYGFVDRFADESALLAVAAKECCRHWDSDTVASEQIDRSTLDAILNRVLRTLRDAGFLVDQNPDLEQETHQFDRKLDQFRIAEHPNIQRERELVNQRKHDRKLEEVRLRAQITEGQRESKHRRDLEWAGTRNFFQFSMAILNHEQQLEMMMENPSSDTSAKEEK